MQSSTVLRKSFNLACPLQEMKTKPASCFTANKLLIYYLKIKFITAPLPGNIGYCTYKDLSDSTHVYISGTTFIIHMIYAAYLIAFDWYRREFPKQLSIIQKISKKRKKRFLHQQLNNGELIDNLLLRFYVRFNVS